MKLNRENLLVATPISGVCAAVTIFVTYGLPGMLFETPFRVITRFGSIGRNEMSRAMEAQAAGYIFGDSLIAWAIASLVGGVVYAGFFLLTTMPMQQGDSRTRYYGAVVAIAGLLTIPTAMVALRTLDPIYLFSWLGYIVGMMGVCWVFFHFADPKVPGSETEKSSLKRDGSKEPADWAIAAARRIAEKD